jgi:hypothetical protein
MNTSPSADDTLAAVIMAIDDEILPALGNPRAQATAVMIQSLLQGLRQTLPVYDRFIVDEHNAMTAVLRDAAAALGHLDGPAADRVRDRAGTLGQWPDLPMPDDPAVARAAHRQLSQALGATMVDLDELQRSGVAPAADEALQLVRAHLGPRFVRDVQTAAVGEGFVGRG